MEFKVGSRRKTLREASPAVDRTTSTPSSIDRPPEVLESEYHITKGAQYTSEIGWPGSCTRSVGSAD
eukprot:7415015-Pyramimonas_sp.AAC.1